MKLKAFGYDVNIEKTESNGATISTYGKKDDAKMISQYQDILLRYMRMKQVFDSKVVENERWYKSQHWDFIRKKDKSETDPEPVTAYLFSTLANKHADAMDNYPEPNAIAQEESDKQEAQMLTHILPAELEKNRFRRTYSRAWWYKLKHGVSAYGIFFNPSINNGLGSIDIKKLDMLNLFWDMTYDDHQDSPFFFVLNFIDDVILKQMYPEQLKGWNGGNSRALDVKYHTYDDDIDVFEGKSIVIDCYYKETDANGKKILHLCKFVDDRKLESTKDTPMLSEEGLYNHAKYPVEFDVLFPEEGIATGFGFIEIIKSPQMYVDKLDQIISKNALRAGKVRHLVKDTGGISAEDLADYSKDVILSKSSIADEDIRQLQDKPLPPFIVQHRQNKIAELKEISSSNDFNRGEAGKGITAASAIMALQEAGNKVSRDMISGHYETFTNICYMVIELIGQFYDETRKYRITNKMGEEQFVEYNNSNLQEQQLPPQWQGAGLMQDPNNPNVITPSVVDENGMMVPDPDFEPKYRKPIFDIVIKPEKMSPFNKLAYNELAKEMFNMGFFNPQRVDEALVAMEMMSFEGKEKIIKLISENGQTLKDLMAQQQMMQQQMMQQQMTNPYISGGQQIG